VCEVAWADPKPFCSVCFGHIIVGTPLSCYLFVYSAGLCCHRLLVLKLRLYPLSPMGAESRQTAVSAGAPTIRAMR
jgi:hypothetical protein